jgi:Uncharacterized protein conserved in bacteria
MYYAIISDDIDASLERRGKARPAHLARLEALRDEGRLLVAGPTLRLMLKTPGLLALAAA